MIYKKLLPPLISILLVFVATSMPVRAAQELSINERIELPTYGKLFDEQVISPFKNFAVGPDGNFFMLLDGGNVLPVKKFNRSGEEVTLPVIKEGRKIAKEYNKDIDPSEVDFSKIKLDESPERGIPAKANDITINDSRNIIIGAGSSFHEFTPAGEFVDRYFATDSLSFSDRVRIQTIAVNQVGDTFAATIKDEIKGVGKDNEVANSWKVDTSQIDNQGGNDYPIVASTNENLFVVKNNTNQILKYSTSGDLKEVLKIADRKNVSPKPGARKITKMETAKSGNLVLYDNRLTSEILVINSNGKILRSYTVPDSVDSAGEFNFSDMSIGPEGNLYMLSEPQDTTPDQNAFIVSADIGLGIQMESGGETGDTSETEREENKNKDQEQKATSSNASGKSSASDRYWEVKSDANSQSNNKETLNILERLLNQLKQLELF